MEKEAKLRLKLNEDLKLAMKSGNKPKISSIRLIISAISYAEIARQASLEDADILGIIAKEARQRQESIEAFTKGNRPDLVAQEEVELAILKEYLPQQVSRQEITELARQVIKETGAQGISDKGKVMPRLIAQLKGKADGRDINSVVTELLGS